MKTLWIVNIALWILTFLAYVILGATMGFAGAFYVLLAPIAAIVHIITGIASLFFVRLIDLKIISIAAFFAPIIVIYTPILIDGAEKNRLDKTYSRYAPKHIYSMHHKPFVFFFDPGSLGSTRFNEFRLMTEVLFTQHGFDTVTIIREKNETSASGRKRRFPRTRAGVTYLLSDDPKECSEPFGVTRRRYFKSYTKREDGDLLAKPYFLGGKCLAERELDFDDLPLPRFEIRLNNASERHSGEAGTTSMELVAVDVNSEQSLEYHYFGIYDRLPYFLRVLRVLSSSGKKKGSFGEFISIREFVERTFGISIASDLEMQSVRDLNEDEYSKFLTFLALSENSGLLSHLEEINPKADNGSEVSEDPSEDNVGK